MVSLSPLREAPREQRSIELGQNSADRDATVVARYRGVATLMNRGDTAKCPIWRQRTGPHTCVEQRYYTLLGVFPDYMLVVLLLLLASISFLLYVDILFWVRCLICVLFSVLFCLCVHVAPAGAPA